MILTSRHLIYLVASSSIFASIALAERRITTELLYQYDEPTWIENLAVRSNGLILPARATSAVLTELNLTNGNAQTIANESSSGSAIMGITEVVPDMFAINTMYCDLTVLSCTAGTGITWSVDLRRWHTDAPLVKKLAEGPSPTSVLNGMAALNDKTVLIVDQAMGGIWAIFLDNKTPPKLIIQDASMADPNGTANGVNGIRVRPGMLYFNNPSLGTFARIPIDPETGEKMGEAEVIATGLEPDDFEIDDRRGVAYLTNGPENTLLEINLVTGKHEAIVRDLAGPTTARWANGYGKQNGVLYVATTGGYPQWLSGNPTVGGAIYKVTVADC